MSSDDATTKLPEGEEKVTPRIKLPIDAGRLFTF
jgi:hypothetical protein